MCASQFQHKPSSSICSVYLSPLSLPDTLFINLIPESLDPGRVNSAALYIVITPSIFLCFQQ